MLFEDGSACRQGCEEALKGNRYKQGSKASQLQYQKAIDLCPTFAYAYMQKAVPFLKRGLFTEWKILIDKAVDLSELEFLGYRGWCRLQFLRDYKGAILDIERLLAISKYDIGYCQTGDYHLKVALAISYAGLKEYEKSIELLKTFIENNETDIGLYDYYHLGVWQYKLGLLDAAELSFENQLKVNNSLAEVYYYKGLCKIAIGDYKKAKVYLEQSKNKFNKGEFMHNIYTTPFDNIMSKQIEHSLSTLLEY